MSPSSPACCNNGGKKMQETSKHTEKRKEETDGECERERKKNQGYSLTLDDKTNIMCTFRIKQ